MHPAMAPAEYSPAASAICTSRRRIEVCEVLAMKKSALLFFALAAMMYATAGAAESPATLPDAKAIRLAEAKFHSLDRNDDLRISKDEAASEKALADRFAAVDSDGDGFLSKSEYEARPSAEPFE